MKDMSRMDFKMWQLQAHPSLIEQISFWLKLQENDPNTWSSCDFEASGIKLLLRNGTNDIHENCLVIASIYLSEEFQNKGILKSLINHLVIFNPWNILAIEDISNEVLINFCEKYGFKVVSNMYKSSYFIRKAEQPKFNVPIFNY